MPKIDKAAYQQRLDRISELLSGIVAHAADQARERCPYRDRRDECTAAFRCRNQRPPAAAGAREQCGHDGTFDYRSAWEADPDAHDRAKSRIGRVKKDAAGRRAVARKPPG
jgi:hypothetical protein